MENHKTESKAVKFLLIGISVLFLFVMLVLPLFVVVTEALKKGWQVYIEAVTDSYTIDALMLTLKATVKKNPDYADRCTGYRISDHCRSYLSACLRKTEYFVPISAKSRDTDCICGAGNYSGNSICNVSVCFPRTSSGAGIHRNR